MKKIILTIFVLLAGFYMLNTQKKPIKLPNNTKILAFGDSLTYGTGVLQEDSYPNILSTILKAQVISSGVPGEVSKDGLKRLKKVLKETNPDILVLCHGANDILRRYDLSLTKKNLKSMITLAQKRGIRVILVGVPNWNQQLRIYTDPLYTQLADEMDVGYEKNILTQIQNDFTLKSDSVHPNEEGYKKMAQAIAQVILQP